MDCGIERDRGHAKTESGRGKKARGIKYCVPNGLICFTRPPYSLKDRTAGEPRVTEKVTENQQKILDTIAANQHITALELARVVGISERKIKDNLKKLKGKGLLTRVGLDKGGHWEAAG